MPLVANSKLGPYEIKSTLGVGGMGEVYRAHDSRLNRDVAIKVLRQDFASGISDDLRSRFEREAHAVAALNHPNIIAVYDFGIESGQQYIVSELLEGESLRLLLKGKPVPVRRLVEIAAQIADGLSAAHGAGIVHRDLKPENIMVAKDGRAKILDFGLARQARTSSSPAIPAGSDETFVPANAQNLTSVGAILGTAAYMSPEQALGQETDYRSDQFSFGLILYEMASGKQAFTKPSSIETMAAIVREEPPPMEEKLPAPLRWIIERCLVKQPEQRYQSTRDLYSDLRNLRDHLSEAYASEAFAPVLAAKSKLGRWTFAAICAACIVLTALLVYALKPSEQNIGRYRYTALASDAGYQVWSPDGKAIAYAVVIDGIHQVFLRHLNSPVPIQLTHEKHDVVPQGWLGDRSHIVLRESTDSNEPPFYRLVSIATVGGEPEFIMNTNCSLACAVSPDGKTWAELSKASDGSFGVFISDPIGSPLSAYTPAPFASKEVFDTPQLRFSPDGKNLLLFRTGDGNKGQAWFLPLPSGGKPPRIILADLQSTSPPTFSLMPDGQHLVVSIGTNRNAPTHLWLTDIDSKRLAPLTTGTMTETWPEVSPDGENIVYSQNNLQFDVISYSFADQSITTLLSTGREECMATWSTNQAKLVWVTNRSGPYQIWVRMPDGSIRPAVTEEDFPPGRSKWFFSPVLSPDGDRVAYVSEDQSGAAWIYISSLSGGAPVRLTNSKSGNEYTVGSWSPDGNRIVFLHVQDGKTSLMISKATGNASPIILRKDGPLFDQGAPEWSPTGEWITFLDDQGWSLISPDGKSTKFLGKIETPYLTFSKNGKLLYGIETGVHQNRATLFSLDPVTLKKTTIKELGNDFRPESRFTMATRLSLSPDGRSFIYPISKSRDELWMFTGYRQPGLWNQIRSILSE